VVRYEVGLTGEAGHPIAVIGIRGKEREKGRSRMRRVAYRDVQFIRGQNLQRWISILPPVLVPDHRDFNRTTGRRRCLDRNNDARRRQE